VLLMNGRRGFRDALKLNFAHQTIRKADVKRKLRRLSSMWTRGALGEL